LQQRAYLGCSLTGMIVGRSKIAALTPMIESLAAVI
jgi:hypothetical protein